MSRMGHRASTEDREFRNRFEACSIAAGSFSHRDHLRLAYVYLCESPASVAFHQIKDALARFLDHHQVDPTKYNETVTHAWVLAVRHFMERAVPCSSFDEFIAISSALLESKIMLTHYSEERLFSEDARRSVLAPDRDPIPTYTE